LSDDTNALVALLSDIGDGGSKDDEDADGAFVMADVDADGDADADGVEEEADIVLRLGLGMGMAKPLASITRFPFIPALALILEVEFLLDPLLSMLL
jgi:hypothetical protein